MKSNETMKHVSGTWILHSHIVSPLTYPRTGSQLPVSSPFPGTTINLPPRMGLDADEQGGSRLGACALHTESGGSLDIYLCLLSPVSIPMLVGTHH